MSGERFVRSAVEPESVTSMRIQLRVFETSKIRVCISLPAHSLTTKTNRTQSNKTDSFPFPTSIELNFVNISLAIELSMMKTFAFFSSVPKNGLPFLWIRTKANAINVMPISDIVHNFVFVSPDYKIFTLYTKNCEYFTFFILIFLSSGEILPEQNAWETKEKNWISNFFFYSPL